MDNFLLEAVKQVPALCVLVWIVWKFSGTAAETVQRVLVHISAADQQWNRTVSTLGDGCHAFQRELVTHYEANVVRITDTLTKVSESVLALTNAHETLANEVRELSRERTEEAKETRHALKDLANALKLRDALEHKEGEK